MRLTGMTICGENSLNDGLLNLSRKLKMDRKTFWERASYFEGAVVTNLNDMSYAGRIDFMVDMANKLYK